MLDTPPLAIAFVCFATGVLSSAVYTHFTLRTADSRDKHRSKKHVIGQAGFAHRPISRKLLLEALSRVRKEETPTTPALRESYFVTQVSVGELLATQGPDFHLAAATAFFKALHIYPLPIDLIMIYQNHLPEPIFKLVMDLMYLDGCPGSVPNLSLVSYRRLQRWNGTPLHQHLSPERVSIPSTSPGRSRVRALPRKDGNNTIAISPSQQILHRALRSRGRHILFV